MFINMLNQLGICKYEYWNYIIFKEFDIDFGNRIDFKVFFNVRFGDFGD